MKLIAIRESVHELQMGNGYTVLFSYETPVAYMKTNKQGDMFYRIAARKNSMEDRHIRLWLDGAASIIVDQSIIDALANSQGVK